MMSDEGLEVIIEQLDFKVFMVGFGYVVFFVFLFINIIIDNDFLVVMDFFL